MPIFKLDHTGENTNQYLWYAHTHGHGFDPENKDYGNLEHLDKIDKKFIDDVNIYLLPKSLKGIDKTELKRIIEQDITLDFMQPEAISVPHLRLGDNWVKLSDYETITSVVGHEGRIEVTLREGTTPNGNPSQSFTLNLSEDTVTKLDSVPNKLDKLANTDISNAVVVANPNGTIARTNIISSDLITRHILSSDPSNNDQYVAASSKALYSVYAQVQKLISGISSCRGRVVNAYTIPDVSPLCNISGVEVEPNPAGNNYTGIRYEVGDHVTIDAVDAVIPAELIVTKITDTGAIEELTVKDGGYYADSFDPEMNVSYKLNGGSGTGGRVHITGVREGVNADAHTCLNDISEPKAGDTVYVMQDETQGQVTTLYMYQQETNEIGEKVGTWVYVMASDSNVICRYEEDITHLVGDEIPIQRKE